MKIYSFTKKYLCLKKKKDMFAKKKKKECLV